MADTKAPVPANCITLEFGDGDYLFKLPVKEIAELQTKCDAGVGEIFARLMSGRYRNTQTGAPVLNVLEAKFRHEDVRETIRLALIGGGEGLVKGERVTVSPPKAEHLVRHYVDDRPLQEPWEIACSILSALVIGYVDPDAEKKSVQERAEPEANGSG